MSASTRDDASQQPHGPPTFDPTLAFRQSSLAGIIVHADNPRWTIVDANDEYLAVTHRTRDALAGNGLLEAFPESSETVGEHGAHNVRWSLEEAVRRGAHVTLPVQRYDLPSPIGGFEEHYWEMSSRPLRDASGRVVGVLHEVKDVTATVVAETFRLALQHEIEEQNDQLQAQGIELELTNQQLKDSAARLRHIFDLSPATIAIYHGPEHIVAYANPTWERRIGTAAATGKRYRDVFPAFRALGLFEVMDRVYETGEPFRTPEIRIPASGSDRAEDSYWDLSWQRMPAGDDGEYEILAYAVDVTSQVQAREAQAFLAEASLVLGSSTDYAATLSNLARSAVPRLGDWCAVDVLDDPDSHIWPPAVTRVAMVHRDASMLALGEALRAEYPQDWSEQTGLAPVLRHGTHLFVRNVPDEGLVASARDARHLELLRALRFRAVIIVPLVARERVVGALTLCMTDSERRYVDDDLRLALDLGRRAGAAVDATRLLRDTEHARARTEAAADLTGRLQRVTAALANAVTVTEVAEIAVAEGVPAFGATDGVVYLLSDDGGSLQMAAQVGLPDATLGEYATLPMDAPLPLCDAIRSGATIVFEDRDQMLRRYPHLRAANARATSGAWLALPLIARDTAVAGLVIGFAEARHFSEEDRNFAETLARLCAQALERATLYDEASEAKSVAEAANAAKSQFLATMSHELRTPLNAFGGYLELLLMELRGPLTVAQRGDLERMQRSNRQLTKLIDDLLNFAKIEVGHVTFDMQDIAVHRVLADAADLMRPQCDARHLTCEVREAPPGTIVRADEERLLQILMNLVGNAAKYTPEGGHVEVWCEHLADTVCIHVRDTGLGIPGDHLEAIFTPFVQVGRRLNAPGEGVGLGLAISRELAEGMGGALTVVSVEGHGSTFTVMLPAGAPPP